MYRVGLDMGGTKIEGVILDEHGAEQCRHRIATEADRGYEQVLDNLQAVHDHLGKQIEAAPHTVGLGIPGNVSVKTGLVKNSNTRCTVGRPMKEDLEARLGRSIGFANDANCFAMAEAILGAGRGRDLVFGVILGTGCGGGIVHKGQVIEGLQNIAGEWGHMTIDPHGPACACGHHGCVERYISGTGVSELFEENYGEKLSFLDIVQAYHRDRPELEPFMEFFFDSFGRAIANLITVLDPDVIVVGGGVSNYEPIYTRGVERVAEHIVSDSLETPILKHEIGDSAGVIGAALIGV